MFCRGLCAVLVVCRSAFVGEGIALTLYAPAACYDRDLCNLSPRVICCLNGDICRWYTGRRVSLKNIVNDLCIIHPRVQIPHPAAVYWR
jgi:hypothetical protein